MQLLMENWRKFMNEQEEELLNEKLRKADVPFVKKFLAIKDLPLEQFVQGLKKISGNTAVRKIALSGRTDSGGPPDEALTTGTTNVPVSSLIPTQKDIGFNNSLADQVQNAYDSTKKVLGDKVVMLGGDGGSPILTYGGRHILDGHHRWSQIMMTNPEATVKIADISGAALGGPEEALKATQLAIAGYTGDLKTKSLGGPDLMQASPEQVAAYVQKNITDDVLQMLAQTKKISKPDRNEAAKYYANNLGVIQQNPGDYDRETSMPQADYTGGKGTQDAINKLMQQGAINFDDPSPEDIKKV